MRYGDADYEMMMQKIRSGNYSLADMGYTEDDIWTQEKLKQYYNDYNRQYRQTQDYLDYLSFNDSLDKRTMNIYALEDEEVIFIQSDCYFETQRNAAERYLEIGKRYTVDHTEVNSFYTDVYLKEFPGVAFNSVQFESVQFGPVPR